MTNQQGAPEALRRAKEITELMCSNEAAARIAAAAAELRRLHYENERLAALVEAQQPAPSAAAEPDMFWDYDDPECFGHDIEDVISEYAPGDIVKIDCAKRMPTIRVRVVANGDDLTYEIIGAPQPSPTPQADSVLEDAARYRWLRNPTTDVALVLDKRTGYVPVDERVPSVRGYYTYEYRSGDELDAAVDAARKQGANHD